LLSPSWFGAIEGGRSVEKWKKWIPEATGKPGLIPEAMCTELELLFTTRNAVVHSKAKVFGSDTIDGTPEILHKGTPEKWDVLVPATARRFAALCIKLAGNLPEEVDAKVLHIIHGVRDHWLMKALDRGARRQSASPATPPPNNSANSKPT
jgi:hypothetical protein